MDSLLGLMNSIYLPAFLSNDTWPESVKKEFSAQLHKFMASLTETAHQVKGHTVLYLPAEDLGDIVGKVGLLFLLCLFYAWRCVWFLFLVVVVLF